MSKSIKKVSLGEPQRITAGLTNHEHPAVSPDALLLAFYAGPYENIHIYITDLDGRLARQLTAGSGNNTQAAWSPDGKKIAYRHQPDADAKWSIRAAAVFEEKEPEELLADVKWHYKHPIYRHDNQSLVYFSDEGTPDVFHIWSLDLESGKREQLTKGTDQNHAHPVFSPDGKKVVFHAYEGTQMTTPEVTNLYELDLKTGEIRALSGGEDQFKHPFYVNEDLITFHREFNADGKRQICAMELGEGKIFELTTGENNDKHPFPFKNADGKWCVAFASKKLGDKLPEESKTYDIFIARLELD